MELTTGSYLLDIPSVPELYKVTITLQHSITHCVSECEASARYMTGLHIALTVILPRGH